MKKAIHKSFATLAFGATVLGGLATTPALADPPDGHHDNGRHEGWDKHDRDRRDDDRGRHDDRRYDDRDRHVVVVDRRAPPPRVIYRYDYNRPDPRYGRYYPDRYYRGGYRPIVVTRETRIYRGYDGRYYCRRSDGTTGLIVGGVLGGVIGSRLDKGHSSVLGTILGAGVGAAIGSSIDRGQVVCR